jgi:myo-inositol 2-dehydrogenase/D-chiro-inositol 1-dehydrogenase
MGTSELIAMVDTDPTALNEAGRLAPDAARYQDLETVFERSPVDAVVICTPPATHADLAAAALGRRLPVYIETPFAPSIEQGREIETAWLASSAGGMTGLHFRFSRVFENLRRSIAEGRAGEVLAVRSVFTVSDRSSELVQELGAHSLDLLSWLIDSPLESVFAAIPAGKKSAVVQVQFESDIPGELLLTYGPVQEHRVEVFGSRGKLLADRLAGRLDEIQPSNERWKPAIRELDPRRWIRDQEEPAQERALRAFIESVRSSEETQPDIADGMLSLIVVDAALRSAQEGRPIRIEEYAVEEQG